MKKLLSPLLAAAAVTACDNDEERNGKQSAVYDGMLIVTNKTQIPNIETISKNVRYELTESNDGTITLTMPGIKFVSNMPALTIVIPNEVAILAAQKDFGIFVILSNLHASPWNALRRYRRRNDIETSYRVVKSDLDGRKPRVWTMTSVRGKEICRHVALGYRFVLQSMMERTAQEAERRANDESLGKTVRKQYEKLTAWIRSMTLKQLLDWFDCVERVEVRNRVAQYRWSTETTARDQMFLELFFDESD